MHKPLSLVLLTLLAFGCNTERPPLVTCSSCNPPIIDNNNDSSMDSSVGMPDASTDASLTDATVPDTSTMEGNFECSVAVIGVNAATFNEVNNEAGFSFEAKSVFARWVPNACDPNRDIQIGFDAEACGVDSATRITLTVDAQNIDNGMIFPGASYSITPVSLVSIRVQTNVGLEWGNCGVSSSGFVSFQSLSTDGGGNIGGLLPSLVLSDCLDGDRNTLIGNGVFSVNLPADCPP